MQYPTQERLKELVHYDPATGLFTWALKRKGCRVGDVCGSKRRDGYVMLAIDRQVLHLGRLAYIYMTGECDPDLVIDHINGIRNDNRWCNLRLISQRDNTRNRHGDSYYYKRGKRFVARISIKGKAKHVGTFDTPAEAQKAALAYKAANTE